MKNRFINSLILLFVLLMVNSGCSDDFLETKPIATASSETFYTTMEAADMATTVCYSTFSQSSLWDLNIMMTLGSIASDEAECAAGGKNDIPRYQNVDQLRHLPSDADMYDKVWGFLYKTIGYCNVALQELPKISYDTDPDFDANLIKKRLAEVHFLRAFNYFYLVQIFGGVPLVDHVQNPDEYIQPRADISQIYDLIKADLEIASNDLPTRSAWGSSDIGRVSKGAAQALMAKTYLFESSYAKYYAGDDRFTGLNQEWAKAAEWAEIVIASSEYELIGSNGERWNTWRGENTGGYQWIFMLEGDNSKEGILEIQNTQDTKGWWYTRGQGLTRWCAPRRIEMNESDLVKDYGWGWWAPGQILVDTYEVGDPRHKATVMDKGDSILCYFADDGGEAWRIINWEELEDGTGVHRQSRKYECSYEEFWKSSLAWGDGPINIKLIRYADLVLWASEAYLELNNQTKATEYINMVRTRARMSGDTGIPANLAAVTHLDIENERLVELGCEGQRFFDVIRWNKGSQYLNHTLSDGDEITYVEGKHEFFPIPQSEVAATNGALEQYDGW